MSTPADKLAQPAPVLMAQVLDWMQAHIMPGIRLRSDSRRLSAGDVFLARARDPELRAQHVSDAVQRGACAVLQHGDVAEPKAVSGPVPTLQVPDLQALEGHIASAWYGHPCRSLTVIAVTGTNGKTSITQWIAQGLAALGVPCAVIGTLGIIDPDGGRVDSLLTTPQPDELHWALRTLVRRGARAVAIEASSIGLAQGRLNGLEIDLAVFSNLSRDHLDYHGTMLAYEEEKARLFSWPGLRAVVSNLDDPVGQRMLSRAVAHDPTIRLSGYTLEGASFPEGMPAASSLLSAREIQSQPAGMRYHLETVQGSVSVQSRCFGLFNVANQLAVAAVLQRLGHELSDISHALQSLKPPPGRLEAVDALRGRPLVLVDYAHTPDAVAQVLTALRPLAVERQSRLAVLVGCGGDRDRGKRPLMAAAAEQGADRVVLTSDNPRSEDPMQILEQMRAGLSHPAAAVVEVDRREAIRQLILSADSTDVVLLAGKGHEAWQEVKGVRQNFSDLEVARQALLAREALLEAKPGSGWPELEVLARWLGGHLHCPPAWQAIRVGRVCSDTRALQPQDLFVALRGDHFDGHDFLAAVGLAGASAAVVERVALDVPIAQIVVPNTRLALGHLAHWWRLVHPVPLVAVVGSNGKTSTKEMLASILKTAHGEAGVLVTQANHNNDIGVPQTLLKLGPAHRVAVIEVGTNHPGEIQRVMPWLCPTGVLMTNAQREHQEHFGSVAAAALENGTALMALTATGFAVFPADPAHSDLWSRQNRGRALIHGNHACADLRWTGMQVEADHFTAVLNVGSETWPVTMRVIGEHHAQNAIAAAAAARALGVSGSDIATGLEQFEPVRGRTQRHILPCGAALIDDSYNANADSMRAAIDALCLQPAPRAVVLGDMGEVGGQGPAMHEEVLGYALKNSVQRLLLIGPQFHSAAADRQDEAIECCADRDAAVSSLRRWLAQNPKGSILVKGSRFLQLDRVVADLLRGSAAVDASIQTPGNDPSADVQPETFLANREGRDAT